MTTKMYCYHCDRTYTVNDEDLTFVFYLHDYTAPCPCCGRNGVEVTGEGKAACEN